MKTKSPDQSVKRWRKIIFVGFLTILMIVGLWLFFFPFPGPAEAPKTMSIPLPAVGKLISLSEDEALFLANLGPVKLGVDPDWDPYEKISPQGTHEGIAADLVRLVAARTGISLELVVTKNWDQTLALAKEGKLDLVSLLNRTPKREEFLLFTNPYFTDPTVLVTHVDQGYIADPVSLDNVVVSLPSGTSMEERLRTAYPNFKFIITADELQAFQLVSHRQADLTVRSLTMAAWTIRMSGLTNLKISGQIPGFDNQLCMGVRKDLPILQEILNKGISSLTPSEVQQVVNRHIAVVVEPPLDFQLLIRVLLIFFLVAVIGFGWIYQLIRINRRIAQREEALALSEQRYRQVVDNSQDGIVVSQDDFLRFINPAMKRITGYTEEELLSSRVQDMVHPEDRALMEDNHKRRLAGESDLAPYDFRLLKPQGEVIWVEVGGTSILWNNRPATLNFISDISQRKQAEEKIQSLLKQLELDRDQAQRSALTDGLTGIPNRRHFDTVFTEEILRLRRSGAPLSLIMIDIDHFKKFNDRYGHQAGDQCLKKVAQCISDTVGRLPDFAARYGGEEFVVLLPETPGAGGVVVAEKIRIAVESLAIPHEESDNSEVVTLSLGLAVWAGQEEESQGSLLLRADQALYQAKREGRNRLAGPTFPEKSPQSGEKHVDLATKLLWHQGYCSGNKIIDKEHQRLFEISNWLLEASHRKASKEEILPILDELLSEVEGHFTHEEVHLKINNYSDLEHHHKLHEELAARAVDLITLYREGRIGLSEIFHFLSEELILEHLLKEDKKYFSLFS